MVVVRVIVTLKADILDPAGKAICAVGVSKEEALREVRGGKIFDLSIEAEAEEALAIATRLAEDFLADALSENFCVECLSS